MRALRAARAKLHGGEEGAGCHADELPEVADEVRLVVVARIFRYACPVYRASCHLHGAAQPYRASKLLGPDADALGECTAEVACRDPEPLGHALHALFTTL